MATCKKCGNKYSLLGGVIGTGLCIECYNEPKSDTSIKMSPEDSRLELISPASKMQTRYKRAYIVARTMNGIGTFVQAVGLLIGIAIAAAGFSFQSQGGLYIIGGFILGIAVATPLAVLGVLVGAVGQVLKATIDQAVNTSPFLTDDQRASLMTL